jgi:hypothetical protein
LILGQARSAEALAVEQFGLGHRAVIVPPAA